MPSWVFIDPPRESPALAANELAIDWVGPYIVPKKEYETGAYRRTNPAEALTAGGIEPYPQLLNKPPVGWPVDERPVVKIPGALSSFCYAVG